MTLYKMAVFMMNICKYRGCGLVFPSLVHLIQHIEDTHIDNDPKTIQQKESSQPSCIPLSYVLRFFTESSRREFLKAPAEPAPPPPPAPRPRGPAAPKTPSVRSNTPTGIGSDVDEEEATARSPSEDSNDSWMTVDEYSSDFIMRHGIKLNAPPPPPIAAGPNAPTVLDKPFACPVPGCKKRYKNVNGIKYHSKNGHKKDGKIRKGFRCPCGKSYTSSQGLKNHSSRNNHTDATSPNIEHRSVRMPGLVVTASGLARPLTLLDNIDSSQLVKIYDSLTPKDIPSLLPKTNRQASQVIPGILTPNTTPETSPIDKMKIQPKFTVNSGPSNTSTKEVTHTKSY